MALHRILLLGFSLQLFLSAPLPPLPYIYQLFTCQIISRNWWLACWEFVVAVALSVGTLQLPHLTTSTNQQCGWLNMWIKRANFIITLCYNLGHAFQSTGGMSVLDWWRKPHGRVRARLQYWALGLPGSTCSWSVPRQALLFVPRVICMESRGTGARRAYPLSTQHFTDKNNQQHALTRLCFQTEEHGWIKSPLHTC